MSGENAAILSVRFPPTLITKMDELVAQGLFLNRNDLIREAVRQLLLKYNYNSNGNGPALAVR